MRRFRWLPVLLALGAASYLGLSLYVKSEAPLPRRRSLLEELNLPPFAVVTACSPGNATLCIRLRTRGDASSSTSTTVAAVPAAQLLPQRRLQCWSRLSDGFYLGALFAAERVLVHRSGVALSPEHFSVERMDELVITLPGKKGAAVGDVWAASLRRHLPLLESACAALGPNATSLDDLLAAVRWGAAYFPTKLSPASAAANATLPPPPPAPVPGSEAYVTFISSSSWDWYIESVRLINFKLRKVCQPQARRPLIAMVLSLPNSSAASAAEVAAFSVALRREGVDVRLVEDIPTKYNRAGRFAGIWGKQRLWGLEGFSKLVYLDPDQLLLGCPAALFSYPPFSHGRTLDHGRDTFNSGTLVVEPSPAMMLKVQQLAASSKVKDDQKLTEKYFGGRGMWVPEYFSLWKRHAYHNPQAWDAWKHCARLLHYTGEKPWQHGANRECIPAALLFFKEYLAFKAATWAPGPDLSIPFNVSRVIEDAEEIDASLCPLAATA